VVRSSAASDVYKRQDQKNQPWFFVQKSYDQDAPSNCFVRANSRFVKPVQPR
jgi:hypothetical protein